MVHVKKIILQYTMKSIRVYFITFQLKKKKNTQLSQNISNKIKNWYFKLLKELNLYNLLRKISIFL